MDRSKRVKVEESTWPTWVNILNPKLLTLFILNLNKFMWLLGGISKMFCCKGKRCRTVKMPGRATISEPTNGTKRTSKQTLTEYTVGLDGSVGCASDWRSGVSGFDLRRVGNILSCRLNMKYFLLSFSPFRWFKKGSCQFLAKECAQYWLIA